MEDSTLRSIVDRVRAGEKFAVGLLAHVQGSAPQRPGARLIVLPEGVMHGTVGGGCLEMETRRRALDALRTGVPDLFELRLDDDFGWDDGLICGGRTTLLVSPHPERAAAAIERALAERDAGRRALLATVIAAPGSEDVGRAFALPPGGGSVDCLPFPVAAPEGPKPTRLEQDGWRVFVESVRPAPTLVVMGCGHIGAVLVEMAAKVGFRVVAVDDRADYANANRLPAAAEVRCDDMLAAARDLPSGPDTYWVIVTRGHRNDGKVLAEVINRESAYLGMIGSRRKVRIIREGIVGEGIATAEQFARVHSPVGLDIGAESPQEIGLAIAAELVAVRHGKRD
ncbi:MAG TPA: XdhC family protein [Armatimonadaceae bacterium]|nr:XdhC family protein [Armatimonadaceae bacterium]